jgi:hypothetical protein
MLSQQPIRSAAVVGAATHTSVGWLAGWRQPLKESSVSFLDLIGLKQDRKPTADCVSHMHAFVGPLPEAQVLLQGVFDNCLDVQNQPTTNHQPGAFLSRTLQCIPCSMHSMLELPCWNFM